MEEINLISNELEDKLDICVDAKVLKERNYPSFKSYIIDYKLARVNISTHLVNKSLQIIGTLDVTNNFDVKIVAFEEREKEFDGDRVYPAKIRVHLTVFK